MTSGCFQALLQRFFTHLHTEHEASHHTISAYRDTFRLLLRFMADHCGTTIDQISWEAFSPDKVLAFLQYLENKRLNTARTRNARLAAIRAFVRFVLGNVSPDFAGNAQRILAIPCKRGVRPVLGFLNLNEVESLLAAIDVSTWTDGATTCSSRCSIIPEPGFRRCFNSRRQTSSTAWFAYVARGAKNAMFLSGLKRTGRFKNGAAKTRSIPTNRSLAIVPANRSRAAVGRGALR